MKKTIVAALVLLSAHAAGATETVLNFDGFVGGTAFDYGGLHWESSVQLVNGITGLGGGAGSWWDPVSPSNVEPLEQRTGSFELTLAGGGAFDFHSVDISGAYATSMARLVGLRDGAPVYNFDYTDNPDPAPAAHGIDKLVVEWGSEGIRIDNLAYQVAAVPEPETYALMLAGLGLVGLQVRRARRV